MKVTLYIDLQNEDTSGIIDFIRSNSWGGARDRVNDATDEQLERVAEGLQAFYGFTSETTINDFIWFDCDDIFFPDEEDDDI